MKFIILILILCVGFNINSQTEKRIALVIGNANYPGGKKLDNPVNDANLMASTLRQLGFYVIKRLNTTEDEMEGGIEDFCKKKPKFNVSLFYYAGHGVQVDGKNYMIPIDAVLETKLSVRHETYSVDHLVEEFEYYPNNTNIVILDACRSNPFRSWSRSGAQGLAVMNPSSGTIIAFATSPNSTAADGDGSNGLYTKYLVEQLKIPQSIESVFKKTRVAVQNSSNGKQSPQEWTKLTGEFYFLNDKTIITERSHDIVNDKPSGFLPINNAGKSSYFDNRNGKTYPIVNIGGQTWMTKNIAFNTGEGCMLYDNELGNELEYGYLYTKEAAQTACPPGWRIPSKSDFETLLNNSGENNHSRYLELTSNKPNGFKSTYGGTRHMSGTYYGRGFYSAYLSTTAYDAKTNWFLWVSEINQGAGVELDNDIWAYSIRCLKKK